MIDPHLNVIVLDSLYHFLKFLWVFLLKPDKQPMQEQESRIIESHRMDAVVRTLDLPHLLKLVVLAILDKLGDELEEMPISIDFFDDLIEKYGVFDVDKLLQDGQCSKSVQDSLVDFFVLGDNEWEVLKKKAFQDFFPLLLLRAFDELRDDLAGCSKDHRIIAGNG